MKQSICFYFQVHQPDRLRLYRFFDIGNDFHYFDEFANRTILRRVADKCYLPANYILLELIKKYGDRFKISFSISGVAIEQFERYTPEVLDSFKALAATGCVEFLAETYSHSLASMSSPSEFKKQVIQHGDLMEKTFGVKPTAFRNTELIYSDTIGAAVSEMGYGTMLTEGAKHILGWKSPNYIYTNAINPRLKLLLRNFNMSDDIAFRFSNKSWDGWPLTADKYAAWLVQTIKDEDIVNLFMDYETFGEHQQASTGIFDFLKALPEAILSQTGMEFCTPSEAVKRHQPVAPLHVPFPISWADEERDTTAWLGNELQNEAFNKIYALEQDVFKTKDDKLISTYRKLQESDHFYYMCTKFFSDGAVHSYFNPYDTPYEAFINYMNVLSDFEIRVADKLADIKTKKVKK
ncbi:MAG: glycoside hydrolase family 57 protein [Bacteroidales bacterium]|nr:glycoside hydrolase family 57 protein [Bacteroidales bacterium]MDD4669899.1 glycoside hydrolase family 57 protein [Bacteroidales bacterium]